MRMSKQVDTRQPPSDVRAPAVAGVGSSVMKLTRKVNRGAYLSAVVRSSFYLGRPINPGGPLGLSVVGSFHGPAWGSGESPACGCALVLVPRVD